MRRPRESLALPAAVQNDATACASLEFIVLVAGAAAPIAKVQVLGEEEGGVAVFVYAHGMTLGG